MAIAKEDSKVTLHAMLANGINLTKNDDIKR